jgi:hypothetical protein
MAKQANATAARTGTEIRGCMLRYFYDRNFNATSSMGKKGSAVKIKDVKAELKALHSFTQQEVQRTLTYLESQGWVVEKKVEKQVPLPSGVSITSTTCYYVITAAGIDKIEGPGEYTMPKFHDIKIEATGQNIITVGDGNQVDASFGTVAEALAELRKSITESDADEHDKLGFVADIDTIQSQLAKPIPNKSIVAHAWEAVRGAAAINGCVTLVQKAAVLIAPLLQ